MMHGFPIVILGTAERDRDIENVQQSIRIAGRLGIPVVEYNFFGVRNVRRPGLVYRFNKKYPYHPEVRASNFFQR